MRSLFEEADHAADALRKRPGFREADLQLMFRHLQERWHPNYTDAEVRDLFELWRDYYQANRAAERRGAIERIPLVLREHLLLINQMPVLSAELRYELAKRDREECANALKYSTRSGRGTAEPGGPRSNRA